MEHSALHALLLIGLLAALGGALLAGCFVRPAARALGPDPERDALVRKLDTHLANGVALFSLIAATATTLDFLVQVAEAEGRTVFAGANLGLVGEFVTQATVGQLGLLRLAFVLFTAAATRLPNPARWPLTALLALAAIVVTTFVSHAAAQPTGRVLALTLQVAHLLATAAWMGVLVPLFFARHHWLADPTPPRAALVAEIIRRFSPFALAVVGALLLSGLIAASRFLHTTGALFISAYGLTLIIKLALLTPALYAGWINFRTLRPELTRDATAALPRFARSLELEVTAGLLVITAAGILGSISPPGDDGALRLTPTQIRALATPDLPTSHVENWTAPEDPRGPTVDDLRYSEFTHGWSGVLVTLLGLGWLAQSVGGPFRAWAPRLIPFLLVPFGLFIALAANPELWLLRFLHPTEAVTNPLLLEHQFGAALVFLLAWLSWRDRRNPEPLRPLGYALPVIMIAGSLLLLGHAHSVPNVPDDLANLINVQHGFFGMCGLTAGTVRWFQLRGILTAAWARWVWPGAVIALGLFMTFFYREVV